MLFLNLLHLLKNSSLIMELYYSYKLTCFCIPIILDHICPALSCISPSGSCMPRGKVFHASFSSIFFFLITVLEVLPLPCEYLSEKLAEGYSSVNNLTQSMIRVLRNLKVCVGGCCSQARLRCHLLFGNPPTTLLTRRPVALTAPCIMTMNLSPQS